MTAVNLRRVDPAPNMRRFYWLDLQPDLFGGVLLSLGRSARARRCVAELVELQEISGMAGGVAGEPAGERDGGRVARHHGN